jgi:hypothetical protein
MMEWSYNEPKASKLGGCTKPWDEEQQKAASPLISYILIQTKNRKSSSSGERLNDMIDIVPLKRDLNKHPNFIDHETHNPFLSMLLDFRVRPAKRPSLELLWTRRPLEAKQKEAIAKIKLVKDKTSSEYLKASAESNVAKTRVSIAMHQIPIVAYGLDGSTFKCLESRPRLTSKLNKLLTANVDPIDQLEETVRRELLESRVCISNVDRRLSEPEIAQVE